MHQVQKRRNRVGSNIFRRCVSWVNEVGASPCVRPSAHRGGLQGGGKPLPVGPRGSGTRKGGNLPLSSRLWDTPLPNCWRLNHAQFPFGVFCHAVRGPGRIKGQFNLAALDMLNLADAHLDF